MNEKSELLLAKIKEVIAMPDVQPGYPDANGNTKVTWCNRAAHRIITSLGGDMEPFLNARGINWTNANSMYYNAVVNGEEITAEQAQALANDGGLVLATAENKTGPGHVGVVAPADGYNPAIGPLIGQAGTKNGFFYENDWLRWNLKPRFFVVKAA